MTFEEFEEILKNRLLQDAKTAMKDGFSSLSDEMKYKEFCRLLDENDNLRNQLKQRDEVIDECITFCNYLLENNEVEIDNEKYFKHSCDDIITNAILTRLQKIQRR